MNRYEPYLAKAEYAFNLCGYFQLTAGLSASARFLVGTVQTVANAALAIFHEGKIIFDKDDTGDARELADHHWEHVKHGLGNIVRSMVELTIIGGLACFIYDWVLKERMKYQNEPAAGMFSLMELLPYVTMKA